MDTWIYPIFLRLDNQGFILGFDTDKLDRSRILWIYPGISPKWSSEISRIIQDIIYFIQDFLPKQADPIDPVSFSEEYPRIIPTIPPDRHWIFGIILG
jgi:hypothetical protein